MFHPSETIRSTEGRELEGKVIVHCVTSSISCFLAPLISRLLMRHGAEVIPVLSPEAAKFVSPMVFEWATGKKPIVQIEGQVEHVVYAGLSRNKADLILIAPITANSISKIANGIMDTSVTLIAGTALGNKIPMIIVPTMHEVMMHNPALEENIEKLRRMGVEVLMPKVEEEKAKIPDKEEIVEHCIRVLTEPRMLNKKVLVTAGGTRAYLDGIRFIGNPSSGKMGFAIANEAWRANADVTLVYGITSVKPPATIENVYFAETGMDMYNKVLELLNKEKYDYVILAAAMNDFGLTSPLETKIKSDNVWEITLEPLPKLADEIKKVNPDTTLVLFKAEYGKTDEELAEIAQNRLIKANGDYIVANDVKKKEYGFASDYNRVVLITKTGEKVWLEGKKREIARKLIELLAK